MHVISRGSSEPGAVDKSRASITCILRIIDLDLRSSKDNLPPVGASEFPYNRLRDHSKRERPDFASLRPRFREKDANQKIKRIVGPSRFRKIT